MKKNMLKNGSIWAIALLTIKTATNFFLVPYITKIIGIEAYGYVALANTVITYIDIIAIAFNYFAQRNVAVAVHRKNVEDATTYYSSIIYVNMMLVSISILLSFGLLYKFEYFFKVSKELLLDVRLLFLFVLFKYFTTLLSSVFEVGAVVTNRLDITYRIKIASNLIYVCVIVSLFSFFYPHVFYIGLAAWVSEILNLLMQYNAKKKLLYEIRFKRSYVSGKKIYDLFFQGIWVSINNLGNILNNGLDLLLCNLMLSETVMGMVSVAKMVSSTGYSLVIAVSDSIKPKLLKLYSEGKTDSLVTELELSMKITGSLFLIVVAVIVSCGENILSIWLAYSDYLTIYNLLVISLLGDVVPSVVKPLYYTYTLKKKMKVPCYITILMGITNVVSMFVLLKKTDFGGYVVVLTTMVINLVHIIDAPIYSAYCLGLRKRTFYPVLVRYFVVFAFIIFSSIGVRTLLPGTQSLIVVIIEACVLMCIYAGLVLVGLFNESERKKLLSGFNN